MQKLIDIVMKMYVLATFKQVNLDIILIMSSNSKYFKIQCEGINM